MSWSFLDRVPIAALRALGRCLLIAAAAGSAAPVIAAEVYIQPIATLTAENRFQSGSGARAEPVEVQGYLASAATLIGIATPNSDTTIRPRIDYRDYPKDSADNRLEEYLDFNAITSGQRSNASYRRQHRTPR